ncbi:BTB/Kelch-associated [Trinorchestia longiramus]|nr:BTB/Kelch-associated [Trinorchestia longiramus]
MSSNKACGITCAAVEDDTRETFRLLFETERGADITLLVGADDSKERIPAHSWVLSHKNDYFRILLTGPMRNNSTDIFHFPDDNPSHFMNLIRWLYGCGCVAEGTHSALGTLQVAIKYLCPELVQHLVDCLSNRLKPYNVLQILAWADHYSLNTLPSAPSLNSLTNLDCPHRQKLYPALSPLSSPRPIRKSTSAGSGLKWRGQTSSNSRRKSSALNSRVLDPTESCGRLLRKCFDHLDANAVAVLACENLEVVSHSILHTVLARDTLSVPNESYILDAMYRWSNAQCRRCHKPLTLSGRRQVLGSMLTVPRLLTLPPVHLDKMDKLYTREEIEFVSQKVKKETSKLIVPPLFEDVVQHLAQPRCGKVPKGAHGGALAKRRSKKDFVMNVFSIIALAID